MVTKLQKIPLVLYFTDDTDFSRPKLVNKLIGCATSTSASTHNDKLELVLGMETGALKINHHHCHK